MRAPSGSCGWNPGCEVFLGGGSGFVPEDFADEGDLSFQYLLFDCDDVVEVLSD